MYRSSTFRRNRVRYISSNRNFASGAQKDSKLSIWKRSTRKVYLIRRTRRSTSFRNERTLVRLRSIELRVISCYVMMVSLLPASLGTVLMSEKTEFAFYVNKNGWRARSNWIIQWEGFPTHFALHYPYVLAFEPTFVEVRHVDSGALMQIIPGNNLRCLFADSPPSNATTAAYFPPPTSYGYQQQQQPNRGRHPGSSARSEIILVDGSRVCSLRFSPPPPPPR